MDTIRCKKVVAIELVIVQTSTDMNVVVSFILYPLYQLRVERMDCFVQNAVFWCGPLWYRHEADFLRCFQCKQLRDKTIKMADLLRKIQIEIIDIISISESRTSSWYILWIVPSCLRQLAESTWWRRLIQVRPSKWKIRRVLLQMSLLCLQDAMWRSDFQ